jgi:hypothetical protein
VFSVKRGAKLISVLYEEGGKSISSLSEEEGTLISVFSGGGVTLISTLYLNIYQQSLSEQRGAYISSGSV